MKSRLTIEPTEFEIQKAIVDWAKLMDRRIRPLKGLYAVPNEGKRSHTQRRKRTQEGMKKGVSDLCLPYKTKHYGSLYIEVKSKRGRLKPEQREWLELMRELGNCAVEVRTATDGINILQRYIAGESIEQV